MNPTTPLSHCFQEADPTMSNQVAALLSQRVMQKVAFELKSGKTVTLSGFGKFEPVAAAARKGRNPRRPENEVIIPAHTRVKFKAHPSLKDYLNPKPQMLATPEVSGV